MKKPKLSVILITYNHEKFIRKAIESILAQETDFPFEIVVGEDCSPDQTRQIIKEYRKEYPDIIRLMHREKNTGRPTLNVYETTMACKGDYLAYLEGDDYWTDTHKLQKQVDFLEAHPEYIACTHSNKLIDENGQDIPTEELPSQASLYQWSGEYTMEDFKKEPHWPGHYATVVSKNIYKNSKHDYSILYKAHDFIDDGQILLFLLKEGNIFRMEDEMSVWRYVKKAGGNSWNSRAMKRDLWKEDVMMTTKIMEWLEKEYGLTDYAREKAVRQFDTALTVFSKNPCPENWQFVRNTFEYNIKHVYMQDKKVKLIPFCISRVKNKYSKKK